MKDEDILEFMDEFSKGAKKSSSEFGDLWEKFEELPMGSEEDLDEQNRFTEKLQAYEDGLQQGVKSNETNPARSKRIVAFPLTTFSMAAVIALMIAASIFYAGYREQSRQSTELQKLLTLTLIQQETAAKRVDGTLFASQVHSRDEVIRSQLLEMIASDPSVNVRLSAIRSLENGLSDPVLRSSMIELISKQETPLVAITLSKAILPFVGPSEFSQIIAEVEASCMNPERIQLIKESIQTQI